MAGKKLRVIIDIGKISLGVAALLVLSLLPQPYKQTCPDPLSFQPAVMNNTSRPVIHQGIAHIELRKVEDIGLSLFPLPTLSVR
jgi:hypothetical protein